MPFELGLPTVDGCDTNLGAVWLVIWWRFFLDVQLVHPSAYQGGYHFFVGWNIPIVDIVRLKVQGIDFLQKNRDDCDAANHPPGMVLKPGYFVGFQLPSP